MNTHISIIDVSEEDRLEAAKAAIDGADKEGICRKYGVNRFVLENWITAYRKLDEATAPSLTAPMFNLEQETLMKEAVTMPRKSKAKRPGVPGRMPTSEERKAQVRQLHAEGLTRKKIRDKVGLSVNTISKILNSGAYAQPSAASVSPTSSSRAALLKPEFKEEGDYFVMRVPKKALMAQFLQGLSQ